MNEKRERKLLPRLMVMGFAFQLDAPTFRVKRAEPLTVFQMIVDYLIEHVLPQQPHVQANRYIYVFNHVFRLMDARMPAEKMGRAEIRAYIGARIEDKASGPTVRRELALLCAARNHAFTESRLPTQMSFKGLMPAASSPRQRYLTREEFGRLMAAPKAPRLHRFLVLAYYTGARARAIEELRWQQVNLRDRVIDFRQPGVPHKNKRRPVQPIIDALLPHLEQWQREAGDEYVIGLGPHGRCSTTYHAIKEVMRSIGIDERGICRHVARHTVASWLIQSGKPLVAVANYLADKTTTLENTYCHVNTGHVYDSVNALHTVH